MVFMDYRDCTKQEVPSFESDNPTFLYVMPMSSTRVFFEVCLLYSLYSFLLINIWSFTIICKIFRKYALQETCLASKDGLPFDILKKKLMARLERLGIQVLKTYEEVVIICSLFVSLLLHIRTTTIVCSVFMSKVHSFLSQYIVKYICEIGVIILIFFFWHYQSRNLFLNHLI